MRTERGVSLIELIVVMVVFSVALIAILATFQQSVRESVRPVNELRALELAQSYLDEVMARNYDEATPTGGIPACGTVTGPACVGLGVENGFNDVDDYAGYSVSPTTGFTVNVAVQLAGTELGLANDQAKRITVVVTMPGGDSVQLSSYRVNF